MYVVVHVLCGCVLCLCVVVRCAYVFGYFLRLLCLCVCVLFVKDFVSVNYVRRM